MARIAIEGLSPTVDAGRFAAKAVAGWPVEIAADIFSDGHEVLGAEVVAISAGVEAPAEPMTHDINDRWRGRVTFEGPGPASYVVRAWRDLWGTWSRDTAKKVAAGQSVDVEILEARTLLKGLRAKGADADQLKRLRDAAKGAEAQSVLLSAEASELMSRIGPRANVTETPPLPVWVDREKAAFSAWYELFPRSMGEPGRHGTFADVERHLDYVTDLGFDVLYFPPIHPIGKTNRKGKNNSLKAGPGDVGSPYAIGSPEGGHMEVHPELGTIEDFDHLVAAARAKGLEIALDIALNASPDHPWMKEHPDWFEWRPDGSIKYAENPPKKYEDIVNFRYYLDDGEPNWPFWQAVLDMFRFWARHGVLNFRVDNPHTKPFPFWEWLIAEMRLDYPGAIFLAEAFTRPKVMKRLAKLGYNQSYSYYTWRNTKHELTEYLTELTTEECRDHMRVNFFVNTPDINPVPLQTSGRPGFRTRAILAASLAGNWGLYSGFEFCEGTPMPGKEEYLDSEKYELRHRDLDAPGNIKDDVRLINRLRRERPALRDQMNLRFAPAFDDRVLCYLRHDRDTGDAVLFHVLLDPHHGAEFEFEVPLWEFGLPDDASVEVQDLIHGNSFTWHGMTHRLELDPQSRPYAIWKLTPPGAAR
ncbi:alpha-1,4-glucan--maltose-1-phosphate maltosyltransferase [Jannaschia formosa]|uniref:alpha-1,4-glucan--maltose-1-phosphate maltosyltransferase n=1 Tax=Jannaschia formosa TaxID=2259592 RepID=UPI001FD80333|nr:alpha-1,4-glucan--maltose-1-phosphate maltosyltransferase [Jannaschia formosa]